MKKILTGIVGLLAVTVLVAGIGYALFSSTATMNGMVLGTATPGLKISFLDKNDPNFGPKLEYASTQNFSTGGYSFQKLLPGEMDWGGFYLKNDSVAGRVGEEQQPWWDTLDFNLKAKIDTGYGDFDSLKGIVQMKVCVMKINVDNFCDTTQQTSFKTLQSWQTETTLPGGPLNQGKERAYVVVFYIPSTENNSIANKTITNMRMEVTGIQQ
jgi:hypothetical protein